MALTAAQIITLYIVSCIVIIILILHFMRSRAQASSSPSTTQQPMYLFRNRSSRRGLSRQLVVVPQAATPLAATPLTATPLVTTPLVTTPLVTTPLVTTPLVTTPLVLIPTLLDRIKNKIFAIDPPGGRAMIFSIAVDNTGTPYMIASGEYTTQWNKMILQKSTPNELILVTIPAPPSPGQTVVITVSYIFILEGINITAKLEASIADLSGKPVPSSTAPAPATALILMANNQPPTLPPNVQRIISPQMPYHRSIAADLEGKSFKIQYIQMGGGPARPDMVIRVINGMFEKSTGAGWVPLSLGQSTVTYDSISSNMGLITREGPNIIIAMTEDIFGPFKIATLVPVM
jgi:hypothetical protein